MNRHRPDTAVRWLHAVPDAVSPRFHDMLLREAPEFRLILDLFLEPPPRGTGRYNHHDGWRTQ